MPLLIEQDAGILTLRLNRPEKRNALSTGMIEALHAELERAELDGHVRVVGLSGAGEDFCAGADLEELLGSADQPIEENERAARRLGEVFRRLRELPKPVVAMVQGRALAGGAGLATACDLVIAAESARFGYPEIQRGFVPAMVLALLRRQVGEKRAADLVLTGRLLSAREAAEIGLVSRVVPDAEFESAAQALLQTLAAASPNALALTKRLLYQLEGLPLAEGLGLGARVNALARAHPDFKAAVARFLRR
jgi:methylglutaconyl-CoA hydratase